MPTSVHAPLLTIPADVLCAGGYTAALTCLLGDAVSVEAVQFTRSGLTSRSSGPHPVELDPSSPGLQLLVNSLLDPAALGYQPPELPTG
jgi:hypothetical protein